MARILIVDDDPDIRQLAAVVLDAAGHTVVTAEDGAAALSQISVDPPDLVLLDRVMPDLSGDDVLARIRANPATATLPVILLTALRDSKNVVDGLSLGADDYLGKPFDLTELRARVQARLARLAQERDLRVQIDRFQQESLRDPLTGLANRRGFAEALRAADEDSIGVGVLAIDVDGLKSINDRYGYAAGDRFLQAVADRFRAVAGDERCLARLGGDEFTILVETSDVEQLRRRAETVREATAGTPFDVEGKTILVTVSVGCAVAGPGAAESAVGDADAALYRAKAGGKNRIAF